MIKDFWCECSNCGETWVSAFSAEHGLLFAADKYGEECTECGSSEIEIGEEYP